MLSRSKILGKFISWIFQYKDCWKNLGKFLGAFLLVHYFQSMIGWVTFTQTTPLIYFGLKYIFSSRYLPF